MTSVEDIKAVAYDLCGVVQFIDPKYRAKVVFYVMISGFHLSSCL